MDEQQQLEQAITVVAQACASLNGNLQQHQQIQQALGVVVNAARSTPQVVHPDPGNNGTAPELITTDG